MVLGLVWMLLFPLRNCCVMRRPYTAGFGVSIFEKAGRPQGHLFSERQCQRLSMASQIDVSRPYCVALCENGDILTCHCRKAVPAPCQAMERTEKKGETSQRGRRLPNRIDASFDRTSGPCLANSHKSQKRNCPNAVFTVHSPVCTVVLCSFRSLTQSFK